MSSATYRLALYRWLEDCHIRDENGRAVHLTPHQWRHTLGTRLKVCGIASNASFDTYRDWDAIRGLGIRSLMSET